MQIERKTMTVATVAVAAIGSGNVEVRANFVDDRVRLLIAIWHSGAGSYGGSGFWAFVYERDEVNNLLQKVENLKGTGVTVPTTFHPLAVDAGLDGTGFETQGAEGIIGVQVDLATNVGLVAGDRITVMAKWASTRVLPKAEWERLKAEMQLTVSPTGRVIDAP